MRRRTRKLQLECLESRRVLASVIQASIQNGEFFLSGSNSEPVNVTVEQTGDTLTVTPGPGTTFGPGDTTPRVFNNVTGQYTDAHMNFTGAGPVNIHVVEMIVPGALDVTTGTGDDTIVITGGSTVGNLMVQPRAGVNTSTIDEVSVGGMLSVIDSASIEMIGGDVGQGVTFKQENAGDVSITGSPVVTGNVFIWRTGMPVASHVSIVGDAQFNGNLSIHLGVNGSTATVEGAAVGEVLVIGTTGEVNVTQVTVGDYAEFGTKGILNLTEVDITGDFLLDAFGGIGAPPVNDVVTIVGSPTANIGGNVRLKLGGSAGDNELEIRDLDIGGGLVIETGDDSDAVSLENVQVGGSLTATLGDGALDTVTVTNLDVVLNASVTGAAGEDYIGFFDSSATQLTIDTGVDVDGVLVENFTAATNVIINGGEDRDSIFVDGGTIGSRLTIQADAAMGAAGDDIVSVVGAAVTNNLRIEGGPGANTLIVEDSQTSAALAVLGGVGNDRILIRETAGQTLSVAGAATLTADSGDDDILLSGPFAVTASFAVDGGPGTDLLNRINGAPAPTSVTSVEGVSALTLADFDVSEQRMLVEAVLAAGRAAISELTWKVSGSTLLIQGLSDHLAELTIEYAETPTGDRFKLTPGALTTVSGRTEPIDSSANFDNIRVIMQGAGDVMLHAPNLDNLHGSLIVQTGDGDDTTDVSGAIGVDLVVYAGEGVNTLTTDGLILNRHLAFSGGSLADTVHVNGGDVGQDLTIKTYGGDSNVSITGNAVVGGDVVVVGETGSDMFSMTGAADIGGSVTVSLAGGLNSATISGAAIVGALSYGGGGLADTVNLSGGSVGQDLEINVRGGANTVNLTGVDVGDDVVITDGTGAADVTIAGASMTDFAGGLYLNLGRGANMADVHDAVIGGSAVTETGDDNDALCFENVQVAADFVANLRGGASDGFVATNLDVGENLTVNAGAGVDNLGFFDSSAMQLTVDAGAGDDGVLVRNFTASTNVVIMGGDNADDIFVENGTIASRLSILADNSTGIAGSDLVRVLGAAVTGNLRIEGGGAADTLISQNVQAGASLVTLGGDGADRFLMSETAGQTMSVATDLAIYADADDDDVLLSGAFAVAGVLRVNGGPGTDKLNNINGAPAPSQVSSIEGVSALTEADFDVSGPLADLENALAAICGA